MNDSRNNPNPGSDAAIDAGCVCAVMDNNHGKFPPWPPDGWWITEGCPLHWRIRTPADDGEDTQRGDA